MGMKKIDAKKEIVDRDGKPVVMSPQDPTVITVGEALSLVMNSYQGQAINAVKAWEMAVNFHKEKEEIKLDKADFQNLKEAVEQCSLFASNGPMIKAQLIIALNDSVDVE